MYIKGVKLQLFSPLSPASDPRPVDSSQRCTSSPPVGWTSYKPEYNQYAFSHHEKKGRRSRLESFPEVRKQRGWGSDCWKLPRDGRESAVIPGQNLHGPLTSPGWRAFVAGRARLLWFHKRSPPTSPNGDPLHPLLHTDRCIQPARTPRTQQ